MKSSSLIFFLIGYPVILFAQGISPVFDEYNFENGLSSNQILCITQDDDDFLWIGTSSGLNRYDGNSFTQYFKSGANGITDNRINDLCVLPNHKLAIATAGGLNFLDTHTGIFTAFQIHDTTALSLFRNFFTKLYLDKYGNLWAGTQTDLFVFNAQLNLIHSTHGNYTPADINLKLIHWVDDIYTLADGKIIVIQNGQLVLYDPRTFKVVNLSEHITWPWTFIKKNASISSSHDGSYKGIWFTLPSKDSIFSYETPNKSVKAYPLFKNASAHFRWFSRLFFFDEKTAYIELADTGFFRLSINNAFISVTHIDNLPTVTDAPAIFFHDHQNNLWIGSPNGLYEWTSFKNQFRSINLFANDKGRTQAETSCFFHKGDEIWIGSYGNGLYAYNLTEKTFQHFDLQLKHTTFLPEIWNIRENKNDTLWIGTQEGLIWFTLSKKNYGRISFPHPSVLDSFPITSQFRDSKGCIWMGVGLGHGVVCYDPATKFFTVYNTHSNPSFPLRHPITITEDETGTLWMGTQRGGGLAEWNRESNQFKLITIKAEKTFSDDRINAIYADHHGYLWIGTTSAGLLRYDIKKKSFETFGKENGLSNEKILNIDGSQYPILWITTALGFDRFNALTNKFESFYKRDGLPSDVINGGIYYDSINKMMYAGYPNGLIEFNPKNFFMNTKIPSVFINAFIVNDSIMHPDLTKNIHFGFKQNNITVHFTAVDLVNGSDLKFRYRLNNDVNWLDAGNNREIHFSDLSPGDYSLAIEVTNKAGVWNEKATMLNFSITPPFWNTTWFYLLAGICIIVIVYLLYRFRIKQLQRVQEMRNRIAQDLHDDIGGTITAMNLTNELAIQNLQEPAFAKQLLQNISEDLKNAGETLDDIVWTVNPKNDSMEEVMARMRRYASHTWEAKGIDFNFDFDKNAEAIHLNMEQRHDLYLVFKEAVNNIAKHSQCSKAASSLSLNDHSLFVEITDNGKGFDVNVPSHRNGIKNMQSRIQKWKGEFNMHSSGEKGTSIRLRMPITQKSD